MTATQPDADDSSTDEKIEIAHGVTIEDAFVEWNIRYSNPPELYAIVSDSIPRDAWEPVSGDPEDGYWIEEIDPGLFRGWQTSLPVSEETGASTTTVEHEELGTVEDRYRSLHHVVKQRQNEREEASVAGVRFTVGPKGGPTTVPCRAELIQEIIDRYVNGPLGSDTNAYWYWKNDVDLGWHRSSASKEDFEPYLGEDVVLVYDSIYTWHPKRASEVTDDDVVYHLLDE